MVELRRALTAVGIEALQPDLVILDEFQRFRRLLDHDDGSWASQLAHQMFDFEDPVSSRPTRTLLLSATPYRPFTTADDTEDDHYEDLIHTARFLLGTPEAAEGLRDDLRALRRGLLCVDRDRGASAEAACRRVGERLQPVMARTERLAATPDRSGMLGAGEMPVSLERADVEGYLAAASAAEVLGRARRGRVLEVRALPSELHGGLRPQAGVRGLTTRRGPCPPSCASSSRRDAVCSTGTTSRRTNRSIPATPDCAAWSPTCWTGACGAASGCRPPCRTTRRRACSTRKGSGPSPSGSSSRRGTWCPR
ncbi:MAG: hypothetical protein U5R31_00485 [Acidimicrobiia bacterium]|nr:hypothetical protein [Acidimicrobiia bacterium]